MPHLALPVEPNGAFLDRTEMSDADVTAIKQIAERSMQSNLERVTGWPARPMSMFCFSCKARTRRSAAKAPSWVRAVRSVFRPLSGTR